MFLKSGGVSSIFIQNLQPNLPNIGFNNYEALSLNTSWFNL